jgi:hypothetical protein
MLNKRKGIETRTTTVIDQLKMLKGLSSIMGFIKKKRHRHQDGLRHYSFSYTEIHTSRIVADEILNFHRRI